MWRRLKSTLVVQSYEQKYIPRTTIQTVKLNTRVEVENCSIMQCGLASNNESVKVPMRLI